MTSSKQVGIEIDKLTRSVENAILVTALKLKFYLSPADVFQLPHPSAILVLSGATLTISILS